MRAPLLGVSAVASAALVFACSTVNDTETASQSSEALARTGVDVPDPVVKPPPVHDAGTKDSGTRPPRLPTYGNPGSGVLAPASGANCVPVRYDLRRATRACEALPGAYVENGVTFVPGTNGRFRVARTLAGTSAPASMVAKTCTFTWEPSACSAPDKAKLLLEVNEDLLERPSQCVTNPAMCSFKLAASTRRLPHAIPSGAGRCEVCGFASGRHMWVVLPPYWDSFRFALDGGPSEFVYTAPEDGSTPTDIPVVLDVDLGPGVDVPEQDVDISYVID